MAFFQQQNIITVVEIGTSKICVIICKLNDEVEPSKLDFAEKKIADAVRKGEIIDMDAVIDTLSAVISDAEEASGVNIDNGSIYVAVTGSHIQSLKSTGSVILSIDDNIVTADHLAEATEKAKSQRTHPDTTMINYIDSYFLIDGKRRLANPVGQIANRLDANGILIIGDRNRVENFKTPINALGIETEVVPVFSALASANSSLNDDEKIEGVLLVDMGAGTTEFIVIKDSGLLHCEVLTVGCEHIANDLALGLDIPFHIASELLQSRELEYHRQKGDPFLEREVAINGTKRKIPIISIDKIIDLRIRELAEVIYDTLGKSSMVSELAMGIVLTGGGSMLTQTSDIFNSVFGIPVRIAEPTDPTVPEQYRTPQYTTICGLLKSGIMIKKADLAVKETGFIPRIKTKVSKMFSPIVSNVIDIKESLKF